MKRAIYGLEMFQMIESERLDVVILGSGQVASCSRGISAGQVRGLLLSNAVGSAGLVRRGLPAF